MLKTGILNPHINSLLSRVRHTNTLVISDRGFPFWPQIETVDISLTGLPKVLDVLRAIRANFNIGKAWMADEFRGAKPLKPFRTSPPPSPASPSSTSPTSSSSAAYPTPSDSSAPATPSHTPT